MQVYVTRKTTYPVFFSLKKAYILGVFHAEEEPRSVLWASISLRAPSVKVSFQWMSAFCLDRPIHNCTSETDIKQVTELMTSKIARHTAELIHCHWLDLLGLTEGVCVCVCLCVCLCVSAKAVKNPFRVIWQKNKIAQGDINIYEVILFYVVTSFSRFCQLNRRRLLKSDKYCQFLVQQVWISRKRHLT